MSRKGENIYHRKDGLWEARYVKTIDYAGKKKYASVYAKTYTEAKVKRQVAIDNIRFLCDVPMTRNTTISQLVEEWIAINKSRLRTSSYQKYLGLFKNHIAPTLGSFSVVHCTSANIQQFCINEIEKGLSPDTINSVLILLHSSLKYGHRIFNFPMPDIIYFPKKKKPVRVLSKSEQALLTRFLLNNTDVYKFGTLLALYTGLRIGELCALKWNDIEKDRIKVRQTIQRIRSIDGNTCLNIGPPKTSTSIRDIPLSPIIISIINMFKNNATKYEYVLGHDGMSIVEPRTLQYNFKKYMKELGMEEVTFHTLRHSFATRCIEQNFEIKSLSEILGHANVQITLSRYVHTSFELKASNMQKINLVL